MIIPKGFRTSGLLSLAGAALFSLLSGHVVSAQETDQAASVERGRLLASEALEAADRDGDGKVSPDEVAGPARLFPRADTDGDGFLTLPEFEAGMVPPENSVANSLGPQADDEALLRRLKEGGLVIIFRHGRTNRDQTDQLQLADAADLSAADRQSMFLDCSRQRTLSDAGREELRRVGAAIRTIGFAVGDLQASPMCRTRETAWLTFGRVTPNDALVLRQSLGERRQLAGTIPPEGTNHVLVSHSGIVASLVWYPNNPANPADIGLPEGNAFVVEPLGNSEYRFLAKLAPADWERLADLSRQTD